MGKRVLVLCVFIFTLFTSFGQNNIVPLRHLKFAPDSNYVVASMDSTGRLHHVHIDSLNFLYTLTPFDTSATTYTLTLADARRRTQFTSSSNITVTIPNDSDLNFPIGTLITFNRKGTGELEVSPDTGVSLRSASNYRRINVQHQTGELFKEGANQWILIGDLKL
jgi:hypothetical protein